MAQVILRVTAGPLSGREFMFTEADTCLIGRDPDCRISLPDDADHRRVSRHQCRLEISPPTVRLHDLQSRNGTRVNDRVISFRMPYPGEEPGQRELQQGDEIHLGATVIRVSISRDDQVPPTIEQECTIPAICDRCWCDVPEAQKKAWSFGDGTYLCPKCRAAWEAARGKPGAVPVCERCGKSMTVVPHRAGELLCAACQASPGNLVPKVELLQPLPQIAGYRVQRELGQGGMGAVYLAQEAANGRPVALKVMLPSVAIHPRAQELFQREMKAIRLLDHPNIVKMFDTGCSGGTFYFTMEYCDGGSVRDLVKTRGPLPVDEAVDLTRQALAGLEHAHTVRVSPEGPVGVVHRDLSPDNLFLSGSGPDRVCKIGDYGLATAIDRSGLSGHTRTGTMGGKPAFVCRQQVRGYRHARPEVDLWALAACLYAMLTGCPPREFPQGRDLWTVVLEAPPIPARQRRPDLPPALAEFLDRALDDSGELRYPTAASFRLALADIMGQ